MRAMMVPFVVAALLVGGSQAASKEETLSPGAIVFVRECGKCHQVGPQAKNRIGPQLNGLFGRTVGSLQDFKNYSKAMREADFTWTRENFRLFIQNPKEMIMGTIQVYKGLPNDNDVSALIDYISGYDSAGASIGQ